MSVSDSDVAFSA